MVKFSLEGAHPKFRPEIEGILTGLLVKYPQAPLKQVHVYKEKEFDRSIGNSDKPGIMELNGHWFSRDPEYFKEAGLNPHIMKINGREMPWHGKMITEPDHGLTHEFGHILSQVISNWKKWCTERWQAATKNLDLAPSGYSLADYDEFGAESFAEFELGFMDQSRAVEFSELLRSV